MCAQSHAASSAGSTMFRASIAATGRMAAAVAAPIRTSRRLSWLRGADVGDYALYSILP